MLCCFLFFVALSAFLHITLAYSPQPAPLRAPVGIQPSESLHYVLVQAYNGLGVSCLLPCLLSQHPDSLASADVAWHSCEDLGLRICSPIPGDSFMCQRPPYADIWPLWIAAEARKEALKGVQDTPAKIRDLEHQAAKAIRSVTGDSDALQAFQQYALITTAWISQQKDLRNSPLPRITRSGRSLEPGHRMKLCSNTYLNRQYVDKQKAMAERRVAKKQEAELKRVAKEKAKMNAAVELELARRLNELNLGESSKGAGKKQDVKKKKPDC